MGPRIRSGFFGGDKYTLFLWGVELRFYILRASSFVAVLPHPPFVALPIHNSRTILSVWDILIAVIVLGQDPSNLMISPNVVEDNSMEEFYQVPPESYPRWKTLDFPNFKHSCFLFWRPVFSSGSEILAVTGFFFLALIHLSQKNTRILSVSMMQRPSWKASSPSASPKIPLPLPDETRKFITLFTKAHH